jgi:hydrogenase maturation protein HypF
MSTTLRRRFDVGGVVQGVGFRPFVHQVATDLGLVGFVRNETTHVHIEVEGPATCIERFERRLRNDCPAMARVDSVDVGDLPCTAEATFRITPSADGRRDGRAPLIPPDTAVCADCIGELLDPRDRRYRHPFITCTNCGPRFTIITAMPYDRPNTTMSQFDLCEACAEEYADPADRRHHAQPLSCNDCGPKISHEREGRITSGTDAALAEVFADLDAGRVVAMKGLGGYHLAVDATNGQAVERLRARKARVDKPFAVMVADLDAVRRLADVDDAEVAALVSPARPVVLLRARPESGLSSAVRQGSPFIGVMLPYTPLHHLLFQPVPGHGTPAPTALVMTSGNVAGEPICFDDGDARTRLAAVADSFCHHDRQVNVPCDDSVVRVIDGTEFPIRRSRGFVPLPVPLPTSVPPILAVGGEIKNTFALAAGPSAWMSHHLGDMDNLETTMAFESSIELFSNLYGVHAEILAVDAHPGYRTRRWAREHAEGRDVVEVQHHHAHLASLMAEHGLDGTEPLIGFVFDGTGYGDDGTLWGGEVLIGNYAAVERWGHLREVRLPGGASAVRNPCRTALAHLFAAGVQWCEDLPAVGACSSTERRVLARQLTREAACVTSTSMGRLFDAVASLLGLRHRITYEAQAAIELEVLASGAADVGPTLRFVVDEQGTLDPTPVLRGLVTGISAGVDPCALAFAFHCAVVEAMATCAERIRSERSLEAVGLTGGVFQNVLLARLASARLEAMGFDVVTHRAVPPNDGGLALGQVMVAAHRELGHGGGPERSGRRPPCV